MTNRVLAQDFAAVVERRLELALEMSETRVLLLVTRGEGGHLRYREEHTMRIGYGGQWQCQGRAMAVPRAGSSGPRAGSSSAKGGQ